MSNTVFYRSVLARELDAPVTRLFESLCARAEQIEALADALPAQIRTNRERREGKPVPLRPSERRIIRDFETDSRKAANDIPALMENLRSEAILVRIALESERNALTMERAVYTGGHAEDAALAAPLLQLRAENIAELEDFVARTQMTA